MAGKDKKVPIKIPRGKSKSEELFALQLKAENVRTPEREFRLIPERKWRYDFCWPPFGVIVEIEGGTQSGGRHVRGDGFEKDCEKYNAASEKGFYVFRYTSRMVKDGTAIDQIKRILEG